MEQERSVQFRFRIYLRLWLLTHKKNEDIAITKLVLTLYMCLFVRKPHTYVRMYRHADMIVTHAAIAATTIWIEKGTNEHEGRRGRRYINTHTLNR